MQHTDTRVIEFDNGTATVEFIGEGGELVSVKMVSDSLERDAAVERAKAIMVQLTTFSDDHETVQDEWRRPDDAFDRRTKRLTEADAKLATILPFADAPTSVA